MRILVIDPSPLFLQAVRTFIGALPNCECMFAASLAEALDLAEAREVDLVLIDYALRGEGAELAAHRIKVLAPAALVLLLTEDAATYRNSCLAVKADGCLAKDSFGTDMPQLVASHMTKCGTEWA